ncbi:MAG: PDZ domain-containing protein [Sphingomonas sp.]|uniref:retropepsin-like aspartic protease n=1 Tax=Sphingomonas sp. TaxID=28214 RepID=UPI0012194F6B|nr:retropepsin-like aspartic protease [Sphingomonas sp.]THD35110.1 MAG: PDZ domain-containing protein [Sphingomonas sp.]
MIGRREVMAALAGGLAMPGIALAADRRVFTSSIALEDNRVLVAVGMNGKGPYIFMIDTGTYVSLIRPDLAKQLKLPVQGYEGSRGVGGRGSYAIYRADNFVIGGGIRQPSVVLEDSFDFGYQSDIYGALAAGILTATDTDLDFDRGELRIYPDGHGDRSGFVALDSEIPRADQADRGSRKIMATVLLEGRPIRCVLDTGAPSVLMLNQTAAKRLGLWDSGRAYAPLRPRGIGGTGPLARTIRVESLEMGGARHDRPLITLLGDTVGGNVDGILGLSFIRRFNLSIDSRGRKLWVQPSRQSVPEARYGLSGLWIEQEGGHVTVVAVGAGSPAAAAGMAVGDRIVDVPWDKAPAAIGGPPGRVVKLAVERGGARRDVEYTLKPYL